MALTSLVNADELHARMNEGMHRLYEGILLERREHNKRGHMPRLMHSTPGSKHGVQGEPGTGPLVMPPETLAPTPQRKPRKQTAPVERKESLRDMSYRLTGKKGRNG